MNRFVRAENLKNNWAFNIIQMYASVSLKVDELKAKLGSKEGPKKVIKGHAYYLVTSNQVIDTMSAIDLASMLGQGGAKKSTAGVTMAWHLYDEHTLIVADVQQLEEFLQADRKPTQLSKTGSSDAPAGSGQPGDGPGGPAGKAGGSGGPGVVGAAGPAGKAGGSGGPGVVGAAGPAGKAGGSGGPGLTVAAGPAGAVS